MYSDAEAHTAYQSQVRCIAPLLSFSCFSFLFRLFSSCTPESHLGTAQPPPASPVPLIPVWLVFPVIGMTMPDYAPKARRLVKTQALMQIEAKRGHHLNHLAASCRLHGYELTNRQTSLGFGSRLFHIKPNQSQSLYHDQTVCSYGSNHSFQS